MIYLVLVTCELTIWTWKKSVFCCCWFFVHSFLYCCLCFSLVLWTITDIITFYGLCCAVDKNCMMLMGLWKICKKIIPTTKKKKSKKLKFILFGFSNWKAMLAVCRNVCLSSTYIFINIFFQSFTRTIKIEQKRFSNFIKWKIVYHISFFIYL